MPILLRRHIIRSSYAGAGEVYLLIQNFRNSKISKFDFIIWNENVWCFEIAVQNTFVMHVENGKSNLDRIVNDLIFIYFLSSLIFFLLIDELVQISAVAKFHDYVQFLPLDDRLAVWDYIDVLELLEQLHLIEYVIGLLLALIS